MKNDHRMMPAKHWDASQIPMAVMTMAALAFGPVNRRSCAEVKRNVVTVKTAAPTRPNFQKVCWQANPAIRGRMPKHKALNTGMQI